MSVIPHMTRTTDHNADFLTANTYQKKRESAPLPVSHTAFASDSPAQHSSPYRFFITYFSLPVARLLCPPNLLVKLYCTQCLNSTIVLYTRRVFPISTCEPPPATPSGHSC
jgi:hypothetical protein